MLLTKNHRLRNKRQFQAVFKNNLRLVGKFLLLNYRHNQFSKTPKLGLSVSTRFGKSHERNRFKRQIREIFRLHQLELPCSLEMNITPRKLAANAPYAELEKELLTLVTNANKGIKTS